MFKKKSVNRVRPLVVLNDPKSPLAEAFRTVRTNIQFTSVEKTVKTILVTSAEPGEGKSTVLANLGVAMAQAGQKVLIVDCDLRRPEQHKFFGVRANPGLTSLLMDDASIEEAVQDTAVENLQIISSGAIPPNPSELLGSERFKLVLDRLAEDYDRVLVDSPPAGIVTDSVVMAGKVDGVLLVVFSERTKADHVKLAQAQLVKAGGNILGVVLNRMSKQSGRYKYYNNYYYRENSDND